MSKKIEKTEEEAPKPDGTLTIDIKGHKEDYPIMAKQFSTGSRGFFVSGKFSLGDGRRYQIVLNLVEIGSKPVK